MVTLNKCRRINLEQQSRRTKDTSNMCRIALERCSLIHPDMV